MSLAAVSEHASATALLAELRPDYFVKGHEYESGAAGADPRFREEKALIERLGGSVRFTYEWTSSSSAAVRRIRGDA